MGDNLCEVCEKNEIVGVTCVPGIPYSAGYCKECLRANAHPWFILVAQVACCGGLEKVHEGFVEMVECTCKHLGKSMDQFKEDVRVSIEELNNYADMEEPEDDSSDE